MSLGVVLPMLAACHSLVSPEVLFTVCIQMLSLVILTQPLVLQVIFHAGFLLPFGVEFGPGLNPLNEVSRDLV